MYKLILNLMKYHERYWLDCIDDLWLIQYPLISFLQPLQDSKDILDGPICHLIAI